jgi:hypothetical protein
MNASKLVVAALPLLWLSAVTSGCLFGQGASPQTVVSKRSPGDLSCPADKVTVENIGGTSFRATGCGMTASYTCMGGNAGNPYDAMCTREGSPAPVAAASKP